MSQYFKHEAWVENKMAPWLHDNGKSSALSGRKNVISWRSDLSDVICENVIHLFKFMRKTIDFISYHLPFEVKKENIYYAF